MVASASFRFLGLSDDQAEELSSLIETAEFGEHHSTGKTVGFIELRDSSNIEIIGEFADKHQFEPTECDIFVSIASEKRDEIWRAPRTVNYMLKRFDCPIVFSYTC